LQNNVDKVIFCYFYQMKFDILTPSQIIESLVRIQENICLFSSREWFKGFRTDCPDGQLHRAKIEEIYNMILPDGNSTSFVDQVLNSSALRDS
jgi:hypothetical protein